MDGDQNAQIKEYLYSWQETFKGKPSAVISCQPRDEESCSRFVEVLFTGPLEDMVPRVALVVIG